jgi:hypothetical protein
MAYADKHFYTFYQFQVNSHRGRLTRNESCLWTKKTSWKRC